MTRTLAAAGVAAIALLLPAGITYASSLAEVSAAQGVHNAAAGAGVSNGASTINHARDVIQRHTPASAGHDSWANAAGPARTRSANNSTWATRGKASAPARPVANSWATASDTKRSAPRHR
jgi:hypothetical protein